MTEKKKSLLADCIRGNKASWDAFVQQYSALVYHTIRKTFALHPAERLPDVVDDVLTLVKDDFLQLRRFRGDSGALQAPG